MRSDYTYETHRIVEDQRFRHQEREHGHLRALKGDEQATGILSRITGSVERLRAADRRGRRAVAHEAQVLTDRVCQLADGSVGRIAIREADGKPVEICIRG